MNEVDIRNNVTCMILSLDRTCDLNMRNIITFDRTCESGCMANVKDAIIWHKVFKTFKAFSLKEFNDR